MALQRLPVCGCGVVLCRDRVDNGAVGALCFNVISKRMGGIDAKYFSVANEAACGEVGGLRKIVDVIRRGC